MKLKRIGKIAYDCWYWAIIIYGIACTIAFIIRVLNYGFAGALQ